MKQPNETANVRQEPDIEPSLEDMLADPLVHLVMQRDGVSRADVQQVIDQTRARLVTGAAPAKPKIRKYEYFAFS